MASHIPRHLERRLNKNSYALLSTTAESTSTAIVFVHGFMGDATKTWLRFQSLIDELSDRYPTYAHSDLYFYDYPSVDHHALVSATDCLAFLRRVFPQPQPELFGQSGRLAGALCPRLFA